MTILCDADADADDDDKVVPSSGSDFDRFNSLESLCIKLLLEPLFLTFVRTMKRHTLGKPRTKFLWV